MSAFERDRRQGQKAAVLIFLVGAS